MVVAALGAAAAVALNRRFAADPWTGARSDHFDGERFFNPRSGYQSEGSFLKWMLTRTRGPWRKWVDATPGPKPPERVDDLRVTFINHATTLIQIDGVNILTDPIWSDRCAPVSWAGPKRHRPPGIRFEDLPPIDLVLVSHNHYDHLDVPTLRRLQSRFGTKIVTPLANRKLMERYGLTNITELDWWQRDGNVTVVPAQHFSARATTDRDRCLWGGFVVHGRNGNVYFAGDTGWGKHFEQIGESLAPIRLALLPIGAYLPRWFMQPAHIDPRQAVEAHLALKAATSVAIHFGTFALGDDGEKEPVWDLMQAIARSNNPRVWILEHGEGRDIPRTEQSAPGRTASSTT